MKKLTNLYFKVNDNGSLTFKTVGEFETIEQAQEGEGPGEGWSYITATEQKQIAAKPGVELMLSDKNTGTPQDLLQKAFNAIKEAGKEHTGIVIYSAPIGKEEEAAGIRGVPQEMMVAMHGELTNIVQVLMEAGHQKMTLQMAMEVASSMNSKRKQNPIDILSSILLGGR